MFIKIALRFLFRWFCCLINIRIFICKTMCNLFPSKNIVYGRWISVPWFYRFRHTTICWCEIRLYNKSKMVFMCKRHDIYFQTEHNKNTHQCERQTQWHTIKMDRQQMNLMNANWKSSVHWQQRYTFGYLVEYVKCTPHEYWIYLCTYPFNVFVYTIHIAKKC